MASGPDATVVPGVASEEHWKGAEEIEEVTPSVGRAYLQQVYFVQHPMHTLGQRTEMKKLMLVVDYLTKNMVPCSGPGCAASTTESIRTQRRAAGQPSGAGGHGRGPVVFHSGAQGSTDSVHVRSETAGKRRLEALSASDSLETKQSGRFGKSGEGAAEGDNAPPNVDSKKGERKAEAKKVGGEPREG